MSNSYQRRKARLIAATLLIAAAQSDTPMSSLAQLAAMMDESQWRTVSLQSGVAVADLPARVYVIAILGGLQ
jgi:hypothetical protein